MTVTLIGIPVVYHIGSLKLADRAVRDAWSQEGNCLSVSRCPSAWRGIAQLGGHPLHELRLGAARYLDATALADEEMASIREWGARNGLVERTETWRAWFHDEEGDEWRYFTMATEQEAVAEACAAAGTGSLEEAADFGLPPCGSLVDRNISWIATMKGRDLWPRNPPQDDATDMLVMTWAEEILVPEEFRLVGVWWNETYDIDRLSAPRGGVFQDKVRLFSVRSVPWSTLPCDEDLLEEAVVREDMAFPCAPGPGPSL